MVNDVKLDWTLVPKTTTVPGEVRPGVDDARQDQDKELRGEAARGAAPQPGKNPTASQPGSTGPLVRTLLNQPPSQGVVAPRKDVSLQPQESRAPKGGSEASSHGAQAEFLKGRDAAKGLAQIEGGGVPSKAKLSTSTPHLPMTPQQAVTSAAAALQMAFRNAFNALALVSKKSVPTGKDGKEKLPDSETPQPQVADGAKNEKGKIRQPNDPKFTEIIAQAGGPFMAQPRSESRRAGEQEGEIRTNLKAMLGLKKVEGGHGIEGVGHAHQADKEFGGGSHTIAFFTETDDQDALNGKMGSLSGRLALDGSSVREMAERLHWSSTILKTKETRPPASVMIAQTDYNTPFGRRVGDASEEDTKNMTRGYRTGLYGGIIG